MLVWKTIPLVVCLGCVLPAEPPARIVIQSPGAVAVVGGAPGAKISCSVAARIRREPGVLRIEVLRPDATIQVPRVTAISINAARGAVSVTGVEAPVQVESAGGSLTFDRITGSIEARTGGGPITADRLLGDAVIETAGGEVRVGETSGRLRIASGGGNVSVGRAGELAATTRGGCVEVERASGPVSVHTLGGAIRLGSISGAVQASTALGGIVAGLLEGAESSVFDTGSGDITLLLPSTMQVTIQARNELAGRIGWVVSDFPEMDVMGGRWFGGRVLMARGSLNGGGPLLRLSASGGVIRLLRK